MSKMYYYYTHLLWTAVLWIIFCGDALIDGRMVGFLFWSVLFAVIMFKQNHIYFPYFSSLHIGENTIERRILGIRHTVLPRDKVYVAPLHINKSTFAVFTLEKLEHYSERDIMEWSWKHKAIMYPITEKMAADFPEMFARYISH